MDIYAKVLKELKKGNAVLIRVEKTDRDLFNFDRLRLVTPRTCEFILDLVFHEDWSLSCFLNSQPITGPTDIVKLMKKFDKNQEVKIVRYEVLK